MRSGSNLMASALILTSKGYIKYNIFHNYLVIEMWWTIVWASRYKDDDKGSVKKHLQAQNKIECVFR